MENAILAKTIQPQRAEFPMDGNVCEGKLIELEQKIASLQQLVVELLATNQQLRERTRIRE